VNGRETPLSRLLGCLIVVRLWCCSPRSVAAVRQIAAANQHGKNFAYRRSQPQANHSPSWSTSIQSQKLGRAFGSNDKAYGPTVKDTGLSSWTFQQQPTCNCSVISLTQVWQRPAVVPRERWGPLRFSPMLSRRLRVSVGIWYYYT
jgi:hypothetical protein